MKKICLLLLCLTTSALARKQEWKDKNYICQKGSEERGKGI